MIQRFTGGGGDMSGFKRRSFAGTSIPGRDSCPATIHENECRFPVWRFNGMKEPAP